MVDRGRIFLAHASEDKPRVKQLYKQLREKGFEPWLDANDLIAGQNWREEIPKAIKTAAVCLACLSQHSIEKKGYVQREFRYALSKYAELPTGSIYLIPVRLDDCEVPDLRIAELETNLRDLHWVDLFDEDGFDKLVAAIETKVQPSKLSKRPSLAGQDQCEAFSYRFGSAFPGVRGIAWFDDIETIAERLKILLKQPLRFLEGDLAWWWRGSSNGSIEKFEHVGGSHFLMDVDEINVRRIAAVNPGSYYRTFVYVEADADMPTGLYHCDAESIARRVATIGCAREEYGLFDNKIPVKREEYDDGAAVIDGKVVDILGRTELRVRYVSPYNFLIAPNRSPINNDKFDKVLEGFLDRLLQGEDVFGRTVLSDRASAQTELTLV